MFTTNRDGWGGAGAGGGTNGGRLLLWLVGSTICGLFTNCFRMFAFSDMSDVALY